MFDSLQLEELTRLDPAGDRPGLRPSTAQAASSAGGRPSPLGAPAARDRGRVDATPPPARPRRPPQ